MKEALEYLDYLKGLEKFQMKSEKIVDDGFDPKTAYDRVCERVMKLELLRDDH
jgi:hypothetical protein